MDQLVWMFSLLPDSIFVMLTYAIFVLGLLLYIASKMVQWIPIMAQYRVPAELVGVLCLCAGAYFFGWRGNEEHWLARIKELEQKVQIAESKSREVNTVIETKIVTKIKVVKETVYANKEIIREVAGAQLDSQCSLPQSSVVLLNSASRNEVARGAESVDGTPSDIKASALLDTVVENYGICNENIEKLKAWQEWYREQKQIFEGVSK
jgi:hypothetical protein